MRGSGPGSFVPSALIRSKKNFESESIFESNRKIYENDKTLRTYLFSRKIWTNQVFRFKIFPLLVSVPFPSSASLRGMTSFLSERNCLQTPSNSTSKNYLFPKQYTRHGFLFLFLSLFFFFFFSRLSRCFFSSFVSLCLFVKLVL